MALTDKRPIEFPVSSSLASPSFNVRSLGSEPMDSESIDIDIKDDDNLHYDSSNEMELDFDDEKSHESLDLSPTSRSISPDSLMNIDFKSSSNVSNSTTNTSRGSTPPASLKASTGTSFTSNSSNSTLNSNSNQKDSKDGKKPKNTPRVPIATGISTTIPVTGEKPRPSQKDDPSLEDDVLYAIFLILYEKDPDGKGMTVKQICDILIDRHPEMANLSTKTSNLVSAKLNAYVKRVEKGDSSLKYALSRDWADASPKRMVYVYRGLLTSDFHVHVKNMMDVQKQQDKATPNLNSSKNSSSTKLSLANQNSSLTNLSSDNDDAFEAGKQASLKQRRSTMFDLGISRNSFLSNSIDKSNLFVPYSSAPVTASLKDKVSISTDKLNSNLSNMHLNSPTQKEEVEQEVDQDQKPDFEDFEVFQDGDDDVMETLKKNGKRSKSMSYLTSKKHKILTAAAAAPRAPRAPCNNPSPNAVAAAAALHAAAIKAINCDISNSTEMIKSQCNKKWLDVIRSGFLSQDIGTPEDISLSDLDKYF